MSEWQNIETAPRDGREILGWWPTKHLPAVVRWSSAFSAEHYGSSKAGWYAEGYDQRANPTHWMPLPEPPEEKR